MSERSGVPISNVYYYIKRYRLHGSMEIAKKKRGVKSIITDTTNNFIISQFSEYLPFVFISASDARLETKRISVLKKIWLLPVKQDVFDLITDFSS